MPARSVPVLLALDRRVITENGQLVGVNKRTKHGLFELESCRQISELLLATTHCVTCALTVPDRPTLNVPKDAHRKIRLLLQLSLPSLLSKKTSLKTISSSTFCLLTDLDIIKRSAFANESFDSRNRSSSLRLLAHISSPYNSSN